MRLAACLSLILLASCTRDLALPAGGDRTPPTLGRFAASPAFAKAGATVTLAFEANEPLSEATASAAGKAAACTVHGALATCTLLIDAAMAEGELTFDVTASDLAHNRVQAPAAASVTLDFTAPVLVVSESPTPAVKGQPASFVVDADEPLGAAPTVAAGFLSGTPVCTGSVPGTRFVCTGATIADAAPSGVAHFTASGQDRAGNAATSAPGTVQVQNPVLPPPHVSVQAVTPNPATVGTLVTITLAANQALNSCAASVAGQLAPCDAPAGLTCTCRFTVPTSLVEGNAIVLAFGTSDSGTGTGAGGVQLDFTAPEVDGTLAGALRHALGADDDALGKAGAVSDKKGVSYQGRGVRTVNVWSSDTAAGVLLAVATPDKDGSFSAVTMRGTDGSSAAHLSPATLFFSAIDNAGNESARVDGLIGRGSSPVADGTLTAFRRNPIGQHDAVHGSAGALAPQGCALRLVHLWDQSFFSDAGPIAEGPASADGSFADVAVGTAAESYPPLYVSGVDKCGLETLPERPLVAGGDGAAPTVDGTLMTIHRRDLTARDSLSGAAGAATATACALASVNLYDEALGPLLAAGPAPAADGSIPDVPFGSNTLSAPSLAITAVDKCKLESAKAVPLDGKDTGPEVDGALMTLTMPGGGQDGSVSSAAGGVTSPKSVLTAVRVLDAAQRPLGAAFLPAADGSFSARSIGLNVVARAQVSATDKAGLTARQTVRNVSAKLDLTGHLPRTQSPNPAAMYAVSSAQAPHLAGPGLAPLLGPEAPAALLAKVAAEDGQDAVTAAPSVPFNGSHRLAQLPFPNGRSGAGFAYDPVNHCVVMFGGIDGGDRADTWLLNTSGWTQAQPANSPPARRNTAMGWDGTRVILFGGRTGAQSGPALQDTWAWSGTDWAKLTPAHSPVGRELHAMASTPSGIVLFGGYTGSDSAETWTWSGSDWTHPATALAPPARHGHGMTWNGSRVVLFGGLANSNASSDTWLFDPSTSSWSSLVTSGAPDARQSAGLAYDPVRQRVVLFGGAPSYGTLTWELNGSTWTSFTPAIDPGYRSRFGTVYDPDRAKVLVLTGSESNWSGYGLHGDVWAWDGAAWTAVVAAPSTRQGQAMAYDSARDRTVVFGGTHNRTDRMHLDETWEFDGSAWLRQEPARRIGPFVDSSMAYDSARGKTVLFGGADRQGIAYSPTAEWDGVTWTLATPPLSPLRRSSASMAYDPARGRMVLFGGAGSVALLNDTWEYDGATWTEITAASPPPPRLAASLVYDPVRARMVLYGGLAGAGSFPSDTWEYDGADWRQAASTGPAGVGYQSMGWDLVNSQLLIPAFWPGAAGTLGYSTPGGWNQVLASSVPRLDTSLAWDSARSRMLIFGGASGAPGALFEPRSNELWSLDGATSGDRWAAHYFAFPADPLAEPTVLHLRYVGAGVLVGVWNWSTDGWADLGTLAGPGDGLIDRDLPGTLADYTRGGRVWVRATATTISATGAPSTVQTDFVRLSIDYTLP